MLEHGSAGYLKVPYKLTAAVANEKRREHMLSAIARGLPRLDATPIDDSRVLNVACYGPSLRETWRELRHPILSMSGATRFLADQGVVADYHIDMDPRDHQWKMVDPPVPGVTYIIGSTCVPRYFDMLKDERVVLWHPVSTSMEEDAAWVSQHDPDTLVVMTGSNIGLAALQVGGLLGFRHFEIHGMDGSFADDGMRHAGAHPGKVYTADLKWPAAGKTYRTNQIMANGAAEAINACSLYPIFCVFHGAGLVQALIREEKLRNACCADEERAATVRSATAQFFPVEPMDRARLKTWSAWEAICFKDPDPQWMVEIQAEFAAAEERRALARYNTGSIGMETAILLRALCAWKQPRVAVEVGTFIGKSTAMLKAERVYTCDKDNDCFPSDDRVVTHPFMTSTQMLELLSGAGVKADLFFFDGRLSDEDVPLVLAVAAPGAVFAMDDFHDGPTGKGLANVRKLLPQLPGYGLVEPYEAFKGRSTLALLVPVAS